MFREDDSGAENREEVATDEVQLWNGLLRPNCLE